MLNIDDNFWIAFKISQDRMYAFWKPDNQTFFGIEAFDGINILKLVHMK